MAGQPVVTGLRPSRGPTTGGASVTLRGENLGLGADDVLDVTFGGTSCRQTLQYESPTKLKVVSPAGFGGVPVVVTTASGGEGTSTVEFFYEFVREEEEQTAVDRFTEVDTWQEEEIVDDVDLDATQAITADEDPLNIGLGARRRMSKKAMQTLGTADPLAELAEQFPNGTSVLTDENFLPAWCLLENYQQATFAQLKQGRDELMHTLNARGDTTRELINTNSSTFVACFESLMEVRDAIDRHSSNAPGGDILRNLELRVQELNDRAKDLFEPTLARRREAESKLNALSVLKKYAMLFNLPKTLRKDIKLENWGKVIADYRQSKTRFAEKKDVPVFAKVMLEVEKVTDTARSMLYAKLEEHPSTLEQQSQYIAYLHELGAEGDPGWFCLEKQHEFILRELDACNAQLNEALEARAQRKRSKMGWGKLRVALKASRASQTSLGGGPGSRRQSGIDEPRSRLPSDSSVITRLSVENMRVRLQQIERDHKTPKLLLVERSSRVLTDFLPSMWRLGQSCTQADGAAAGSGERRMPGRRPSLGALPPMAASAPEGGAENPDRLQAVEDMLTSIIASYALKVRDCLIHQPSVDEDGPVADYLPRCERQVRACHQTLSALGLPEEPLEVLPTLLADLHQHIVKELFAAATTTVSALMPKEDWKPVGHGMHTRLPELFETELTSTFSAMSAFLSHSAATTTEQPAPLLEGEELFCKTQKAFINCLTELAFGSSVDTLEGPASPVLRRKSSTGDGDVGGAFDAGPTLEQRLTCVMSNCLYTREHVMPRLVELFNSLTLGHLGEMYEDCVLDLEELDHKCFNTYLKHKGGELTQLVRLCSEATFESFPPLGDVRPYVKEVLMSLVCIHADVRAVARPFLFRVLSTLIARVAREVYTRVSAIKDFGRGRCGIQLLKFEVSVFQHVLRHFDRSPSVWAPVFDVLDTQAQAPTPSPSSPERRESSSASSSSGRSGPGARRGRGRQLPTPESRSGRSGPRKKLPSPGASKPAARAGGKRLPVPTPGAASAAAAAATPEEEAAPLAVAGADLPQTMEEAVERFVASNAFQLGCFADKPGEDTMIVSGAGYDDVEDGGEHEDDEYSDSDMV